MDINHAALSFAPPEMLIKRFRLNRGVSEKEARERFEETKKFLFLCANGGGETYAPSREIDEMWHEFLLYSRSYLNFCSVVGTFLHHEPADEVKVEAYRRTQKEMKNVYGNLNPYYWADNNAGAGSCCSSCGSSIH